ncbi:TRAP transporter substrate-binding protein [Pseudomonas mangiferae]|uniref:TRAP transporter substrate-binding protein n=1 Tax=Pseudomonas mangiferae TaxID=2593654 RepID=A0A553GVJ0_9PSED|nr:TRAP transporter substrate-binding protein [Pseudomonas mangiferae]TRX73522.1 TRAP transporter substrate-binding protein [Pseudomonas mangiferae]
MFKTFIAVASCVLALASTSLSAADATAPIVIKFSHVVADDTPKGQGALLFKKLVEQRLGGQVQVEVHPNSSLFGDADELEALRKNEVQLLAPSLAKFEQYTKQLQVFDLPFLFDDLDAVNRFQKRAKGRQLLRSMESNDIVGLAYWHNGMRQFSGPRALRTPKDAAGLAFRIQPSDVIEAQFARIGATSAKIPFAETLAALQSGKVQASENTWSNLYSQKLYTVQPVITESNHGALDYMLVSNPRFWYSIPHATRTQLEAIIDEVTFAVNHAAEEQNRADRERIVATGKTQVVSLSAEERQAWREAMRPVWKQFEPNIGEDILKAAEIVNRKK